MGSDPRGPNHGVCNFVELFSQARLGKSFAGVTGSERTGSLARFEHKVSDHVPLWLRLRLPD